VGDNEAIVMLETLQRETRADIVRLGEKPVRGQPRGERCRPAGGQGQGPADPEGLPFPSSQKRRKGQPPKGSPHAYGFSGRYFRVASSVLMFPTKPRPSATLRRLGA
jgi:hypothetical protein